MYIGGRKKKAATAEKNCPVSCDGSHPCGYAHAPLIFTAAGCQKERTVTLDVLVKGFHYSDQLLFGSLKAYFTILLKYLTVPLGKGNEPFKLKQALVHE